VEAFADVESVASNNYVLNRIPSADYCWFCLFQQKAYDDVLETDRPTWTRRESKQDWSAKFKHTYRRDDLEHSTAHEAEEDRARSDGYRTPREEREDRWREEGAETATVDKAAARAYYKGLKNSKAKGKGSGFGAPRDRTGFEDSEGY
jgi:hypothetical protein